MIDEEERQADDERRRSSCKRMEIAKIRMERILLPTDFSPLATHALRYASDLASAYRCNLHILHVVVPQRDVVMSAEGGAGIAPTGMGGILAADSLADLLARETRELTRYVAEHGPGLHAESILAVRCGVKWEEIVRYAAEAAIDMIVIGSHARGVMKRILLGSTSKAVLEHAGCPVLMVPSAAVEHESQTGPAGPTTAAGA